MELIHREGLARIAKFETAHGAIETPTILPVINPNLVVVTANEMKKLGSQGVITNSYIIRRNPNLREHAEKYGLHSLLDFDGPIMTDSGTFQSYVYGDMEYENLEIVEFQKKIGSDISTILDIFSRPDDTYDQAKEAVLETYRRINEVHDAGNTIIAGPIQGSIYPDLRRMSAEKMGSSIAGYLPIGGVVPLLENYEYETLVEIIINAKLNTHFGKPAHLFGGGHPMFMAMAVLIGIDVFDSASYVKYARDDRLLFPDGTRDLKKMAYLPTWSPIYEKYTVKELTDSSSEERIRAISLHNLYTMFMELREIKERIYEQTLWQYVEAKSRGHPYLFKAFLKILEYSDLLVPYEELYRKSPYYSYDHYSDRNVSIGRLKKFTQEFLSSSRKNAIVLPKDSWKPGRLDRKIVKEIYEKYDVNMLIQWENRIVPVELEETYPVEQILTTSVAEDSVFQDAIKFAETSSAPGEIYFYSPKMKELELFPESIKKFDLEKIRAISDFQFGLGTGKQLFPDNIEIIKSRSTERIRNIILDGKILVTMRAHDGFFTLTTEGAKRLLSIVEYPRLRVKVTDDSAEYNAKGLNVFFKFISDYDPKIIALNETLVVNKNDELIAVGRSTVSGNEMGHYRKGVAVKVHHSIEGHL